MFHTTRTAMAAALVLFCAPVAQAQQVTGGSLTLSHSAFTDDTDLSKTSLLGSVELGFNRNYGLQADLGMGRLNNASETVTNAVLHGIYHLSDTTSVGLFLGLDRLDGETQSFVGLEMGTAAGPTGFEAYIGYADDDTDSGTMIGLSTRYGVSEQFGLGVSLDHLSLSAVDATRYSVNADYAVTPNVTLFGEVGALNGQTAGGSGTEGYVKLGGKVTFGAKRGTTFDQRSLLSVIPGF
jgi:hypothetical protein